MTNVGNIEQQITAIEKYLSESGRFKKYSQDELIGNLDLLRSCERSLYLLTQSCIDLAESVISFKSFRKPTTLKEAFGILNENGLIDYGLAKSLSNMTGFRNALAHDYGNFDYDIMYKVLQNGSKDIEEFIASVKKAIE